MPAVSKAQQRFFGMVDAYRKGDLKSSEVSKDIKRAADDMSMKEIKKFAKTKHKGLPNHKKSKKKMDENVIESVVKQIIGQLKVNESKTKDMPKKVVKINENIFNRIVKEAICEINNNDNGMFDIYYSDGLRKDVLQLSDDHIMWKFQNDINPNEYYMIIDYYAEIFEKIFNTPLYYCGRSGRHVCVDDTPRNRRMYGKMIEWVENAQREIVNDINSRTNESKLNRIVRESINKISNESRQINETIYVGSGGGCYGGSAILTVDNDEGQIEYRFRPSGWDFDTTSQLEAAALCSGANNSFMKLMSESELTTLPVDTPTDDDKREALYWLTGGNAEWQHGYWIENYDIQWNDAVEIFMQDNEFVGLIDNAVSNSNNFYELVVNLKNNNWMLYAEEDLSDYERYDDDMEESVNREKLRSLVKENVKRMLSEGGDFLMQHDDGEYVTTSKRLYRNVPGAIFIWHGDSADPEILYKNHLINYYNVEDSLWNSYKDECEENGTEPTEEGYDEWAEQLETDFIISELDDIIAGL